VSQFFLPQLALLHDPNALDTLQAGQRQVDRHWDQVAGLAVVSFVVLVAGALFGIGLGLFIAWPVVVCIQTAAYRQLFGPTDHTGFSSKVIPGRDLGGQALSAQVLNAQVLSAKDRA
jgi:uncharacterized membrane protein